MTSETIDQQTGLITIDARPDLVLARAPLDVLAEARRAAAALKDVIDAKPRPVKFNGETYLEFEDWLTCARFYGVAVKVASTSPVEFGTARGFEARAVALLVSTGQEVSAAEAMCLNDEPNWKNKPLFQIRSMAQTRACAKALRNVLAWVVVLAGYRPTPAEEMTVENGHAPAPARRPQPPPRRPQAEPDDPLPSGEDLGPDRYRVTSVRVIKEGKHPKTGTPYTLYGVSVHTGQTFVTFSSTIFDQCDAARQRGTVLELVTEASRKGTDRLIVSVEPVIPAGVA